MKPIFKISLFLFFQFLFYALAFPQASDTISKESYWAYDLLKIPHINNQSPTNKPIVVAVVDDAFRTKHDLLAPYFYRNTKEIPNNQIDDDQNGYIDDVQGYDISDNDPDVNVPFGKEAYFYHGSIISGIITQMAERAFGNNANLHIKIIPVKVLSDKAQNSYISDGYKGIQYAIDQGAQIICCAWSGGTTNVEENNIILQAQKKGISIIGSAGNLFTEKVYPPASIGHAIAVAGIDINLLKTKSSNYGMRVDFVASAEKVISASSLSDHDLTYGDGTSSAAALVAGSVAILSSQFPTLSQEKIIKALKNTASPIDHLNYYFAGKLGYGIPNLIAASAYLQYPQKRSSFFDSQKTKGDIVLDQSKHSGTWDIKPPGSFKSIQLGLQNTSPKNSNTHIIVKAKDSTVYQGTINEIPLHLQVPGSQLQLVLPKTPKKYNDLSFHYFAETIDSATIYCREQILIADSAGIIDDGSQSQNYANHCACKWLIQAPIGKRIAIETLELDTEANVDFLWLFDGSRTLQEFTIAKFSGQSLPPKVISRSNQVLVWFVADAQNTGKGWKIKYQFVDL